MPHASPIALLLLAATASARPVPRAAPVAPPAPQSATWRARPRRLFFAFHGDVRPAACNDTAAYPTAIIESIFRREAELGVEFAVDLGDHMYVCNGSLEAARTQMGLYVRASQLLHAPTYMAMGNHECGVEYCAAGSTDANFTAFLEALRPISYEPWYRVNVPVRGGYAAIVMVADNAWDERQAAWLDATLANAERDAKYLIVVRHHPVDDLSLHNPEEWQIIQRHRYALVLTGHSHHYRHDVEADPSERSVRLGCGGAPLDDGAQFFGFGTVEQQPDDRLLVRIYDSGSGNQEDAWSVAPREAPQQLLSGVSR